MKKVYVYDKQSKEVIPLGERGIRQRVKGAWPMRATMADAGTNDQLDEMRAIDKVEGIAETEYIRCNDGFLDPIWRNRNHKKRWLEAHGQFDRDAGYSDAQPKIACGGNARGGLVRRILRSSKGG